MTQAAPRRENALRWTSRGCGAPVSLVVPGLGSTQGEARIPASGLPGTRVVVTLPGHGDAPDPPAGYWNYARIAEDVAALADEVGATVAIGTSLGAGAILRVLSEEPDRFEAVALLLPAALDRPRDSPALRAFDGMADAVESGDRQRLRALVADQVSEGVDVGGYVDARTDTLARLGEAMRVIPEQTPVPDPTLLSAVTARTLVVGATKDPLHAEEVARAVGAAIPLAQLEILDSSAPLLTHRARLRSALRELV